MSNVISGKDFGSFSGTIIISGITGIVIGATLGLLYYLGIFVIPAIIPILTFLPFNPIITGVIAGAVIALLIGGLVIFFKSFGTCHQSQSNFTSSARSGDNSNHSRTGESIRIHEEQLNISKIKKQTGKVEVHKEIVTEEKNITVPIKREELVIEKTSFGNVSDNSGDSHKETIRIPVSEEKVDITKHSVPLQQVSINKHHFEDIEHITETVKKEIPRIRKRGDVEIKMNNDNDN